MGASTVLVPASALLLGQLALMVGNPLGVLNPFGVSPLAHLDRVLLVKAGRLLVELGRTVVSLRCALVRAFALRWPPGSARYRRRWISNGTAE